MESVVFIPYPFAMVSLPLLLYSNSVWVVNLHSLIEYVSSAWWRCQERCYYFWRAVKVCFQDSPTQYAGCGGSRRDQTESDSSIDFCHEFEFLAPPPISPSPFDHSTTDFLQICYMNDISRAHEIHVLSIYTFSHFSPFFIYVELKKLAFRGVFDPDTSKTCAATFNQHTQRNVSKFTRFLIPCRININLFYLQKKQESIEKESIVRERTKHEASSDAVVHWPTRAKYLMY